MKYTKIFEYLLPPILLFIIFYLFDFAFNSQHLALAIPLTLLWWLVATILDHFHIKGGWLLLVLSCSILLFLVGIYFFIYLQPLP